MSATARAGLKSGAWSCCGSPTQAQEPKHLDHPLLLYSGCWLTAESEVQQLGLEPLHKWDTALQVELNLNTIALVPILGPPQQW